MVVLGFAACYVRMWIQGFKAAVVLHPTSWYMIQGLNTRLNVESQETYSTMFERSSKLWKPTSHQRGSSIPKEAAEGTSQRAWRLKIEAFTVDWVAIQQSFLRCSPSNNARQGLLTRQVRSTDNAQQPFRSSRFTVMCEHLVMEF